jgi:hypothetical protein
MNINEIREQGIGSNFKVINQADGYQKNNRLWFGDCVECGERVTNSNLKGVWVHTIILERDGHSTKSKDVDFCPTAKMEDELIEQIYS